MNIGDLTAKIEANKKPLAIAGAAGVAGLALLQRRKAGGDVGTATAGGAKAAGTAGSSLAAPNGQVVYSSEASDAYNALQPQLSTIGTAVNQLLANKAADDKATTSPIPVPAPVQAPLTNREWLNRGMTSWAKEGQNPLDMQAALTQYLNGDAINRAQASGVGWIISNLGAAPEGTKGVSAIVPA